MNIDREIKRFMKRKPTMQKLGDNYVLTTAQYSRLAKVLEYFGSCKKAENMHITIATMIQHDLTNYVGRIKRLRGIPGTTVYTQMLRYGRSYATVYTDQSKKKTSHFKNTLRYWLDQGFTHGEAYDRVVEVQIERSKKSALKTTGTSMYTVRSVEFWLSRGYSLEQAHAEVNRIQVTNGLAFYVNKYGKTQGAELFAQRINKWQQTLSENNDYDLLCLKKGHSIASCLARGDTIEEATNNYAKLLNHLKLIRRRPSTVSQKLFDLIVNKIGTNGVYYDSLNYEFLLSGHRVDFFHKESGTVVEFYGDFYHRNPAKFAAEFVAHNISSAERWNIDETRISRIKDNPLVKQVIIVWESEYRTNPQECANSIIERIYI